MFTVYQNLVCMFLSGLQNWIKPYNQTGSCVRFDFLLLDEVSSINKEIIKQVNILFSVTKVTREGLLRDTRSTSASLSWAHGLPHPLMHKHSHSSIKCTLPVCSFYRVSTKSGFSFFRNLVKRFVIPQWHLVKEEQIWEPEEQVGIYRRTPTHRMQMARPQIVTEPLLRKMLLHKTSYNSLKTCKIIALLFLPTLVPSNA